jgi:predicted PurR-regulated permease PerM
MMLAAARESLSLKILAVLAVIGALYAAKAIFIPLAMAILLTFVLAPGVRLLRGLGLPRVPSSLVVVVLAFTIIIGIGAMVGQQLTQLAERLPLYEFNITTKIQKLRGSTFGGGTLERLLTFVSDLNREISRNEPAQETPPAADEPKPVPVRTVEPPPSPLIVIQRLLQPLVEPLTTSGLMAIFVIFFLLEREDLRDRIIKLAGSHDLRRTTEAITDGAQRLSRYFLAQTGLNMLFGVIIGAGLALIGVPNPVLWGILAMLLRFVPYIGALLAALFPIALAVAVGPGWSMALWTLALFLVVEPLIGQVLEPVVYGHSAGLTPVAVLVSATFWTWIWGPIGLILSTPLAVCLSVLGRHIESLHFLEIMLGNERPLSAGQRFYQRALSGNADEATEQVEECLRKEKSLARCYDDVVLEALTLAQVDVLRDTLDEEHAARVNHVIRSMLAEMADQDTPDETEEPAGPDAEALRLRRSAEARASGSLVLCVGGPGAFDRVAAEMLAQLLQKQGFEVRLETDAAVSSLNIGQLEVEGVDLVCLSNFSLGQVSAQLRYAIRRIRRRMPTVRIMACMWGHHSDEIPADEVAALGADACALSMADAVKLCVDASRERAAVRVAPTAA